MSAIATGQARLRLDALISSWEQAMSRTLDHIIYLVKSVVQEPVGIIGNVTKGSNVITLKPNELKPGIMHFYVELDAETPEERDRRYQLGMSLQDRRGLSKRTIIRDFYSKDAEYEQEQMLIEDAMNDPNLRMQLAISIMQSAGMTEVLNMIQSGQMQQGAPDLARQTNRNPDANMNTQMRLGTPAGAQELGSQPEIQGAPNG